VAAATLMFLFVLHMIPPVLAGNTLNYTLFSIAPGVSFSFRVDAMGVLFAVTASFLWILTTFYSIGYMRSLKEHAQTRYYLCFMLTMSATIGVAFAANLLTLYLCYELVGVCAYPLVVHNETEEAYAKGNKYIFYLFGMAKLFLLACFVSYGLSDTLDFKPGGVFPADVDKNLLTITFFLFVVGVGAKAAIMPLHPWLPAAMIAPTPVSALLHAVAVVKVGVFTLLRVGLDTFGLETLKQLNVGGPVVFLVCLTIVVASVIALTKDNLKARLAYSTISQLSYIILGMALLTTAGVTGGVMHIANHAFSKITLFFCAGAIYVASGKTKVSELNGIGKQMPFTMAAFTIGSLSLIAFPPFAGFISKWYLIFGAVEAEQYYVIAALVTSSILNACYFLPIVYAAYFRDLPSGEKVERREAPVVMVVPVMLTAVSVVVLFLAPSFFLDLARMVLPSVTGGG
jgi:multicomponent Na+:H+ antiporter subunit D